MPACRPRSGVVALAALALCCSVAVATDPSDSASWGAGELISGSEAAAGQVVASVSWPVAFDAAVHDTDSFRASVIAWLAEASGVSPSSIVITSVRSGSVVVTFELSSAHGGGRTSVQALAALEAALLANAVPLLVHNGVTFPRPGLAVVSSPSALCDLADTDCGVGLAGSRYHIDWNQVTRLATQDLSYPVTPQSDAVSTCTCDMTELYCDVTLAGGCACDLDCSSQEIARFTAKLPEGAISNRVEYCDADSGVLELESANLDILGRSTVGDVRLFSEFVDSQLCVVKENDPTIGVYYTDPGPLDSVTSSYALNTAHKQNLRLDTGTFVSSFSQYTFAQPGLSTIARAASYGYGQAVAMYPSETTECVAPTQQYAPLPASDVSGSCSDLNLQTFGVNAGPSLCAIRAPPEYSLANSCGSVFGMNEYIGQPSGGSNKKLCLASNPAATVAVPVNWVVRGHYGTSNNLPHGWSDGTSTLPITSYDHASATCQNVPTAIFYTISHDGDGTITYASAEVWYRDISEPQITVNFTAAFVVGFVSDEKKVGIASSRSLRSGQPGYIPGMPLLAGRLVGPGPDPEVKHAIAERAGGLAVAGAAIGGACLGGAKSVKFGYDSVSACSVKLTLAELRAACDAQGTNDDSPDTTLFSYFQPQPLAGHNVSDTHIGIFGDASFKLLNDWIEIKKYAGATEGTWTDSTSTCRGLITEYRIDVYIAPVGNVLAPQWKVIEAYQSYGTSAVQFRSFDSATRSTVELRTVVTFIEMPDRALVEQVKPPPRLLPAFPDDMFYPFEWQETEAHSGSMGFAGASIVLLAAAIVIGLLV